MAEVNKEDIYFDSCAWLDSDCEDDFFSVKGGMISVFIHYLERL